MCNTPYTVYNGVSFASTKELKRGGKRSTIKLKKYIGKRCPPRAAKKDTTPKKLRILELDPSLGAFEGDVNARMERYKNKKKELLGKGKKLSDFANGHHHFGFHKTKTGWVYREWAPSAKALHLVGDFNNWDRTSHPLTSKGDGTWISRKRA